MLEQIRQQLDDTLQQNNYAAALKLLSGLRGSVDQFFDTVMVMTDDQDIRNNRLALLSQLRNQFLRIADISLLHTA